MKQSTTPLSLVMRKLMHMLMLTSLLTGCEALMNNGQRVAQTIPPLSNSALNDGATPEGNSTLTNRPSNAIFLPTDGCVCLNGKADSTHPNCPGVCASRPVTTNPTLYLDNLTLGPAITESGVLSNLFDWCFLPIDDGLVNPSCSLKIIDAFGFEQTSAFPQISSTSNSIMANVAGLNYGQAYILRLVENSSGATSSSIGLTRQAFNQPLPPAEVLPVVGVHYYECINTAQTTTEPPIVLAQVNQFYYFPQYSAPQIIPPSVPFESTPPFTHTPPTYCHNIHQFGNWDKAQFPRKNVRTNQVKLWNGTSVLFYDLNSNQNLDIHDYVVEKLAQEFSIPANGFNTFAEFNWPTSPLDQQAPSIGYYMQSWVNSVTNLVFCPTQTDYQQFALKTANGGNPTTQDIVLKILGEVINQDTEPFYAAKRETQTLMNPSGVITPAPDAFMLIGKSELMPLAFYFLPSGQKVKVTNELELNHHTIRFYYPPCAGNNCSPLTPTNQQLMFTIETLTALFGTVNSNQVNPADKRIGCIPTSL